MAADRTEYTKTTWENNVTKLNATNLNHIEQGIYLANQLSKENANLLDEIYKSFIELLDVSYDALERTFTFSIGNSDPQSPEYTSVFNVTKRLFLGGNAYTVSEIDAMIQTKQATLVNQQNIKSVGGQSLLGSGDLSFDNSLTSTSVNAPKTKVVKEELDKKLAKVTTAYTVYGVNGSGEQTQYAVDTNNELRNIPRRQSNGNITVPTNPINTTDAASKNYVDNHHDSTKQDTLSYDTVPTANSTKLMKSGDLYTEFNKKQDKLKAGTGISISPDGTISYNGTTFEFMKVTTLPATGDTSKIYLLDATDPETGNICEEYIYVNNAWELIGTTKVDLSNYYVKSEVDTEINKKQDKLASGVNIKTLNGASILGDGDMTIEAGAIKKTGDALEDMTYKVGQLYYCTSASESFSAGALYMATSTTAIVKMTTTSVSTAPAIKSFSISPTSTEYGDLKSVTYSYSLKKPSSFSKLEINNTTITTSPAASGTGTISGTYDNQTFTLKATYGNNQTLTKNASITALYRYFIGAVSGNNTAEVLTNLKNVKANTASLVTNIGTSLPAKASLSLGSTPIYVYFIVPSSMTINTLKSGGFDIPFHLDTTSTFTNSYNASYNVKIYITDNKVFGDMEIDINK